MLKIIKVPDESTFKESDLKPDLKMLHKDGRQFTLNKHSVSYWSLTHNGVAYEKGDSFTLMFPREIVPLLNRDFRRVESQPQYKTVGEVPVNTAFDTALYPMTVRIAAPFGSSEIHCLFTDKPERGLYTSTLSRNAIVTRVHGPITIDPSVTEGV